MEDIKKAKADPVGETGPAIHSGALASETSTEETLSKKRDTVQHDIGVAFDFLRRHSGGGEVQLHAIEPDGPIETRTFPTEVGRREYIERWSGRRNIYFTPNPLKPTAPRNKKPTKADMAALACCHVDVDPKDGEAPEAAETRAMEALRVFRPWATEIVFSGGGVQAFWKLRQPIPVTADPMLRPNDKGKLEPTNPEWHAEIDRLERANKALAKRFGGDNCHNIDRIMRVPGTVNIPGAKKRAKGRAPRPATLKHIADFAYELVEIEGAATSNGERYGAVLNHHREGREGLPPDLKVRFEALLARDDKVRRRWEGDKSGLTDESRSGMDMSMTGLLKARGYNKPEVSLILHTWKHGKAAEERQRYADRMFDKAAADADGATGSAVDELNKEYATAWAGANYVIIREHEDEHGQAVTNIITKESFDLAHKDRFVQVDDKIYPLADVWLRSPRRRRYKGVIFAPDREVPGYFNLWKGWGVEPDPAPIPEERCKLFLAHTRDVICDGDDDLYCWVLAWMADGVQDVRVKKGTALVLQGIEGIGKGVFASYYGAIFGAHFKHILQNDHLVGKFNEHQKDMLVCFADECFYAGDLKHAGLLKGFITEGKKMIEPKFVGAFQIDDCARLIMSTNNDWAVPAGLNARRFCMLKVSDEHDDDAPYFDKLTHEMRSGGPAALMAYLRSYDVKPHNLRRAPKTKALLEQKVLSMTPEQGYLYDMLMRGRLPGQRGTDVPWAEHVVCEDVHDDYIKRVGRLGNSRKAHETLLATRLRALAPPDKVLPDQKLPRVPVTVERDVYDHPHAPPRKVSVRKHAWRIPELAAWRSYFDHLLGQKSAWPTEDADPPY